MTPMQRRTLASTVLLAAGLGSVISCSVSPPPDGGSVCRAGCTARDAADGVTGDAGAPDVEGDAGDPCSNCGPGDACLDGGSCRRDPRGPFCEPCVGGIATSDCGPGNLCVSDGESQGAYCAVTCAEGEACPSGFECRGVFITPNNPSGYCQGEESFCPFADAGQTCLGEPAAGATVLCGCWSDDECPVDECVQDRSGDFRCDLSREACEGPLDCPRLRCNRSAGGCEVTQQCQLEPGLSCDEPL